MAFGRLFWMLFRIFAFLLSIGVFAMNFILTSDNGFSYLSIFGFAASVIINLSELATLPSLQDQLHQHTWSPRIKFLMDSIAWVMIAYGACTFIVFHRMMALRLTSSTVDGDEEDLWDVKSILAIAFYFALALAHVIMSLFDLIELKRAGHVTSWVAQGKVARGEGSAV